MITASAALLDAAMAVQLAPWLVGIGIGAAVATLVLRARHRPFGSEPARLWQALGGDADTVPPHGLAGFAAVRELAERRREEALRSTQLQLRTVAAEERRLLCDTVLGNLHDGLLVVDATERVLYANAVAKTVLQLGEREHPTLQEAGARFEIVEGVRTVLAADLARGVKSCRIELADGERKAVFLIRAIAAAKLAGSRDAQVVVLEDWTAE
ncbi:MAG: hypothetical protein JNK15_20595, partial [Planctomycetes bacterium]|nr:hypothetical protein [Planctomycetota bacterium]